jgi:hypothetical protein
MGTKRQGYIPALNNTVFSILVNLDVFFLGKWVVLYLEILVITNSVARFYSLMIRTSVLLFFCFPL